jgi:GAF domain-containing protein
MSAAALSGRGIYYLTAVLVIGKQLTVVLNIAATSSENLFDFSGEFGVLLGLLIVSVASRYSVVVMERAVRESQRRTRLLEATAEIGQVATAMLDLNALFSRSVEMIKDRFGFYHVQVFMVNGDQAELVASTGEVGQRLLANKHKLPVGSNSVIGYVTRYGEAVIARSTDAVHRFNPLLPDTRTELAVPIFEGDKIIGALDMQSVEPDAFRPEDVQALRSMANALAAAIRNAQLFEVQERSIQEQQRLYLESQDNLREIQRLNRQLTRAGWDDYLRQSSHAAGVTLQNERIVTETEWTDSLIEAARQRQVVTRPANGRPGVVAVPVVLRGEVIGAIEVEPTESTLQRDAVETVQAIAQRLATSLENARLFEEAQAATVQEQRINQIVTRYQSATTVDDLLRITLTELSEALGAQRGAIRLGMIPDDGGSSA